MRTNAKQREISMSWNYRIIKTKDGEDNFYQIHEVYYSEDGKINGYTSKGATVGGSNIAEVKWVLMEMLSCLERDIITDTGTIIKVGTDNPKKDK
jgi:hypothetical protein